MPLAMLFAWDSASRWNVGTRAKYRMVLFIQGDCLVSISQSMSTKLLHQQSGLKLLPKLSTDSKDAGESKPVMARSETMSLMDRRLSRGVSTRRKSRVSADSPNRRGSNVSMKSVPELAEEAKPPSATVLRLRALAHAVRARHLLGIQQSAQKKYLLQAAEAGTDETDVGVDMLMEGIQTKLKEEAGANQFGNTSLARNNHYDDWPGIGKAKVRFTKEEGQSAGSANSTSASSLYGKAPQFTSAKGVPMKRGSSLKPPLQRTNTIRGDVNTVMTPYQPKPSEPTVSLDYTQNMGARITCAHSLYKLSCQTGTEFAIVGGGAIAQIGDFSDVEDSKLLRYCAAILVNVTTELSVLEDFAGKDGVSTLLELSWTPLLDIKVACTTALCRLSCSRARAAVLVRNRAITELMSMLTVSHVHLQQLVVTCIVNLVYYGHVFPERVFVGDPQAVQSPLGLMNIVSQLSASPSTYQFAGEVLFNLSLYRSSCLGVLRGGGAETLFTLVSQLCKLIDGNSGGSSSRYTANFSGQAPAWTADINICMKLLRLSADTLANFSAFVEYHGIMGSHGMKALSLMLSGALRDVGTVNSRVTTEERFRCTSVSSSRALANFSSNVELRHQNCSQELIQLATKLALMDHQRYAGNATDARALMRNAVRTLCNLSFEPSCRSGIMEMPQVLTLLHAIAVLPPISIDGLEDVCSPPKEQQSRPQEQQQRGRMPSMAELNENPVHEVVGGSFNSLGLGPLSDSTPIWYMQSSYTSTFPWTIDMSEDTKEDALIALLNFAQQATYANELLRTLDGKRLAIAAEDVRHSRRLRYIYSSVLCNLLFDSHLQQLVYGDQVVRALVRGFNFFETMDCEGNNDSATSLTTASMTSTLPNSEKAQFQALNLASDDDQERFLASIFLIASELMDMANIDMVVMLVQACLKTYMNLATSIPSNAPASNPARMQLHRQLPAICYASASLFALTRAATQRRDSHKHLTHSDETEEMLIAVCALPSGSGGSGPSTGASSSRGGVTHAFCAATLYHMCASTSVNQRVIQGLINCCNANEESQSLLACSAAFAIISFTAEGCQRLVQCANLARALNRLGRTSQVECQQYAAIAACNVSTVSCVWSSAELKDFIVVALLRANSIQAKQIHAKTLSNLLSHGPSRPNVVEDGVLYALMKLSQVMMSGTTAATTGERRGSGVIDAGVLSSTSADEVFSIGLRALFNLSCDRQYHHKLLSNGVMAYLSTAVECRQPATPLNGGSVKTEWRAPSVNDPTVNAFLFRQRRPSQMPQQQQQLQQCQASHLSIESRRFALAILCNLASYEENHKELMHAQVAEIIRNYVDGDIESLASAAMALRNLSCRQPWVEMLCERKTLQLLVLCTECDHPVVRQFAMEALANCSQVTDSIHLFGEMHVPRAVLTLLEVTGNAIAAEAPPMTVSWKLSNDHGHEHQHPQARAPVKLESTGTSTYTAALKCLQNVAHDEALALALMEESIILRLLPLLEYRAVGSDVSACEIAAGLTHTLAGKPRCAEALLRQRTVSLCALLHRRHTNSTVIARECVWILMLLSTYQHIQLQLCETQAVHVVVSICGDGGDSAADKARDLRLRECGAVTIRNLTLSVTEHLALFYEKHDDGDGALQDIDGANTEKLLDIPNDLQTDDDDEAGYKDSQVSLMLERHMLHGIKYFQEEIVSGQASERILLEASVAIANLSTVKVFRVEMVRLGVIHTLLQLLSQPKRIGQRLLLSMPALTPGSSPPVRLRHTYRNTLLGRICAATLHRLVVEDGVEVDSRSHLVPSLLTVVRQTDDELQQVRYECEKISIFSCNPIEDGLVGVTPLSTQGARGFTQVRTHLLPQPSDLLQQVSTSTSDATEDASPLFTEGRRAFDSCSVALLQAGHAVTQCVRQTYREQKWMVYVLKTILSSQAMIPQLEKKQMRVLGAPKLCFQDVTSNTVVAPPVPAPTNGSSSSRSTNSATHIDAGTIGEGALGGGYLLPVNMEKHVIRRVNGSEEIVPVSAAAMDTSPRPKSAVTTRPIVSGIGSTRSSSANSNRTPTDASTIDQQGHARKFNRQMRLMRRNDRRDSSSLPPV